MRSDAHKRALGVGFIAFGFAAIPFYPALVSLAAVTPPGVSLVPPLFARVVLTVIVVGAVALLGLGVRQAPSPLVKPMLAYVAALAIAALLGLDPATGALFVGAGLLAFVFHLGITRYYAAPGAAAWMYGAFLTSGLAVTVLGLALLTQHQSLLFREVNGRAVSTFIVPGEFAGYLCFLVPIGAGIALTARLTLLRAVGGAAAIFGAVALWSTFSRAGIFGLSAGIAFFIYMQRSRWWVGAALVVALALEARWLLGFNDHHNPGEEYVRLPIWEAAARTMALFPLTGTGPGAFRHVFSAIAPPSSVAGAFHAHSYPLTVLTETGLLGIATVAALWWSFVAELRRARARAEARARLLALALAAAFVATWVQGAVDFVSVVVLGLWLPCMALTLSAAREGTAGA
jgi:O-antigen ligase